MWLFEHVSCFFLSLPISKMSIAGLLPRLPFLNVLRHRPFFLTQVNILSCSTNYLLPVTASNGGQGRMAGTKRLETGLVRFLLGVDLSDALQNRRERNKRE
jgi:hypothetical protein